MFVLRCKRAACKVPKGPMSKVKVYNEEVLVIFYNVLPTEQAVRACSVLERPWVEEDQHLKEICK